ncbi:hypothetical protein C0989_008911, partial [Termitomyces sp. Mn162]
MPQSAEEETIKVLKSRTYTIPAILSHKHLPTVHWDLHDKKFFVTQVQASWAAASAVAATDLGSNNEDNVATSKRHSLDSKFDDDDTVHCQKKKHNTNVQWLLAIDAKRSKMDLKQFNNT